MENKNPSKELPDISNLFNFDETDIPDTIIEKDGDSASVSTPILTSTGDTSEEDGENTQDGKKSGFSLSDLKDFGSTAKNIKLNKKQIIAISAAAAVIIAVIILSVVLKNLSEKTNNPEITTALPEIESIEEEYTTDKAITAEVTTILPTSETAARTYTTDKAVTANDYRGKIVVFFENDYDIHHIEKGQSAVMTDEHGQQVKGTVFDIKEVQPGEPLVTKCYSELYDKKPSTAVYAVLIETEEKNAYSEDGILLSQVKVTTKVTETAMTVPNEAVFYEDITNEETGFVKKQAFVWVHDTENNVLRKTLVGTGIVNETKTEITSGLETTSQIAVTFSCTPEALYDGINVTVAKDPPQEK